MVTISIRTGDRVTVTIEDRTRDDRDVKEGQPATAEGPVLTPYHHQEGHYGGFSKLVVRQDSRCSRESE